MLKIENLTKYYDQRVIFDEINYHFPQGEKIAVVGDNGTGKTTLLNMLCGLDTPDGGKVVKPQQTSIGFLPQEPNPNPEINLILECEASHTLLYPLKQKRDKYLAELEHNTDEKILKLYEDAESNYLSHGGYELTARIATILSGLGFAEEDYAKSPLELSGGWRMRLELAKIFLKDPDVLILDEPTNHLDLPSLAWVEKFLRNFPGTLIFVSHDRDLLNRLSTITVHLENATLTAYRGNYDAFLKEYELRAELGEKTLENLEKRQKELQLFVDRFGAKASKATQASSKMKMIEKLEDEKQKVWTKQTEQKIRFTLSKPPAVEKIVLTVKDGAFGYNKPLSQGLNLQVERGQKIAIIGANGVGKSTLLKTIVNRIPALAGEFKFSERARVAYFAQDQLTELSENKNILENVLACTKEGERYVRSILGSFLFTGSDVFKPLSVLSGGEKSRVGLACVLVKEANIIILDEPTNHLDMKSVKHLVSVLKDYEGTVIFVSHDRYFINALCSHVHVIARDGQSATFMGHLADYEQKAAEIGFPNVLNPEESSAKKAKEQSNPFQQKKSANRDKERIKKQMQEEEKKQIELKKKIKNIEEKFSNSSLTYQEISDLQIELSKLQESLLASEMVWLELGENL